MADGFDLRDEPWIPVRLLDGGSVRLGLRELFYRAHEVEDLELPVPPAASGLLRILAAITARIAEDGGTRLDDEDVAEDGADWLDLRERILARERFDAKAVDAYFDDPRLAGRFDLFDPMRPFLQDPRLVAECVDPKGKPNPSGVNKLVLGRPTGVNGAVLFGHFTDASPVPVPAVEAAWHLIAQLYYGPSGQCTPRRITSIKPGNGDAGPLRKTISFHVWAPDLFTSLVLAVPAPDDSADFDRPDACPWEDELPDPLGPPAPLTWPGRLLTGRARHAVLLVPSEDRPQVTDAYITWSTHELAQAARDPYLIFDLRRDGTTAPREADGSRALWRDVDALLLKDGDSRPVRPRVFDDLPDRLRHRLRVRAYGFDQDGQQRDSSWFEAITPPVLQWQEEAAPQMARHLSRCHQTAEDVGDKLHFAARLAWKLANDPNNDSTARVKLDPRKPGPWASEALVRYWPAAEQEFWRLADPALLDAPPHRRFVNAALEALDEAIGPATRADLRVARARSTARAVLLSLLPTPSEKAS
ncbi:type I-E CRISPR-associated protein Cse1/CasA [Streptomyces sp. NPDC004647]|uniref:type I-E CRISPR-associated protein Cse1/CasA n=1 Tax=Streptomyces sp. NPDC004647 TaxID=3154671 RepID=UPI0033B8EBA4